MSAPCPKCENTRDNVTVNYCTICDKQHIDVLCAKCGNRYHHELPPPKQNESPDETKRISE
jgi:hypothetical protein